MEACSGMFCARGGAGGVRHTFGWVFSSDEARGRGRSKARVGRTSCARGVEVSMGLSCTRLTGGGSSLTKSKSHRTLWAGARARGGGASD